MNSLHPALVRCLELAQKGKYSTKPNPCVGCTLTKKDHIIGEGWHQFAGEDHAEVAALKDAQARGIDTQGATAWVSLEPCAHHGKTPPCTDALIAARVKKVVIAIEDPNPIVAGKGVAALRKSGIEVESNAAAQQARSINPAYFYFHEHNKPWVTLKAATSLDGRIAAADGTSQWISSPEARADAHLQRLEHHAILSSSQTVLRDNAQLTIRLNTIQKQRLHFDLRPHHHSLRVILDSHNRLKSMGDIPLFSSDSPLLILTQNHAEDRQHIQWERCQSANEGLNLQAVMQILVQKGVQSVLVEAGSILGGAFIKANLVNQLFIYQSSILLGNKGYPAFVLPHIQRFDQRLNWQRQGIEYFGNTLRHTFVPIE